MMIVCIAGSPEHAAEIVSAPLKRAYLVLTDV